MDDTNLGGFDEMGYRVTWQATLLQSRRISELRADVFCRELKWVGCRLDTEEQDEFDPGSTPIAVLDRGREIVGSVRITPFNRPWMLDSVFRKLAPAGGVLKTRDSAEASRLLVTPGSRRLRLENGVRVCDLLYKGAYAYCQLHSIRYLYVVVSDVVLQHLQRAGLPCCPLAAPQLMPDGVVAVAVRIDWSVILLNSALAAWYNSGRCVQLERRRTRTKQRMPVRAANRVADDAVAP